MLKNRLEGLERRFGMSEAPAQSYTITPGAGSQEGVRGSERGFKQKGVTRAPRLLLARGGLSPASTSAGLKPSRKTLGAAHSVLIMTLCRGWYQKS